MIRWLMLGLLAAVAWKLGRWLFMPSGIATDVAAVCLLPIGEELLRLLVLSRGSFWAPMRVAPAWPGALYGLGFGLWEAGSRWVAMANGGLALSDVGFLGTMAPLLLHVLLGIVLWRFLMARRAMWGLLTCVLVHSLHNAYVYYLVTRFDAQGFTLDVLARLIIFGAAITWMLGKRP